MAGAAPGEAAELLAAVIHSRQTVLPRRLGDPAPDAAQLATILGSAAAAPDHGQLTPWRFVIVPEAARDRLAEAFAAALMARDAQATTEQVEQAREKAHRAPLLMLAIGQLEGGDPEVDASERLISAGCAIQNVLLTAHAMGFGAALTSGKALKSQALSALFNLASGEQALCFINIGTPHKRKPARERPAVDSYVSVLAGE
ncbi:MAG: nitroreductase [Burkholderiaceae bacterium]|nr:nitroreductase [Burkholderiaceae bacterium]